MDHLVIMTGMMVEQVCSLLLTTPILMGLKVIWESFDWTGGDGKGDEDEGEKVILHAWEGTQLVSQVGSFKMLCCLTLCSFQQ